MYSAPVARKANCREANKFSMLKLKYTTNRLIYLFPILIWSSFFLVTSCGKKANEGEKRGGVALSFDDRFIDEWFNLRPLFQKYGAKVTFYITGDTLDDNQIAKLKTLLNDGHEIGFHGTIHGNAELIVKSHGVQGYIEMEITPGMDFLRRNGFNPTSYAHPGGGNYGPSDEALISYGFINLRDVAKAERKLKSVKLYHIPPALLPQIFYKFDKAKDLSALEIDKDSNLTRGEMRDALEKAKKNGSVLMMFGHQPLPLHPKPGMYGFDVALLESILADSKSLDLKFYTMSELK